MTRLVLIPVASWRWRATARAAITTVRWAQVASRVWWKTGRARRSCLLICEGLLDVPQLVIRGDNLGGVHQTGRDVRDVALETHQGTGPGDGGLIQGRVTSVDGDKTRALRALLAVVGHEVVVMGRWGQRGLSCQDGWC